MSWEKSNIQTIYASLVKAVIVLLFAYTATDKLLHYRLTMGQMQQQLLPEWLKPLLPLGIPLVEILLALALIIFAQRLWPMVLSALLMYAFTLYVGVVYFGDFPRVPCSCGGIISSLSWGAHFYFNLSLSLLITIAICMKRY